MANREIKFRAWDGVNMWHEGGNGGLFIQLQKKGVVEKTGGYRLRDQGNASAIYRLKNGE